MSRHSSGALRLLALACICCFAPFCNCMNLGEIIKQAVAPLQAGGAAIPSTIRNMVLARSVMMVAASMRRLKQDVQWSGNRWQYQIGEVFKIDKHVIPGVRVYMLDGYETPKDTVTAMRAQGLLPVCYIDVGSYEDWRPDAKEFKKSDLGDDMDEWEGERWSDVRSANVRRIVQKRLQMCADKGFVGVEPDNTDAYENDGGGLGLTEGDLRDFLKWLSQTARGMGLSIGLKNTLVLINDDFVKYFDFAVNEQCSEYDECKRYAPFVKAGKPVFNVEYTSTSKFMSKGCKDEAKYGLVSIRKTLDVKAKPRDICPGSESSSPTTPQVPEAAPSPPRAHVLSPLPAVPISTPAPHLHTSPKNRYSSNCTSCPHTSVI